MGRKRNEKGEGTLWALAVGTFSPWVNPRCLEAAGSAVCGCLVNFLPTAFLPAAARAPLAESHTWPPPPPRLTAPRRRAGFAPPWRCCRRPPPTPRPAAGGRTATAPPPPGGGRAAAGRTGRSPRRPGSGARRRRGAPRR